MPALLGVRSSFWLVATHSNRNIDTFDDLAGPPPNIRPPPSQPASTILDARDSNNLNVFFEHFDSSEQPQYPTPSLRFSQGEQNPGQGALGFAWPPPTFEGSWSQPRTNAGMLIANHGYSNTLVPTPISYDSDVIQGAAFLAHSAAGNTEFGVPIFDVSDIFDHQELGESSRSPPGSTGGQAQIGVAAGVMMQRPHASLSRHSSSYHEDTVLVHDPYQRASQFSRFEQEPPPHVPGMTFGSDPHFHMQGFMAPPGQPTEEAVINGLARTVDYSLHPASSAENTRPSSPVSSRPVPKPKNCSEPSNMVDNKRHDAEEDVGAVSRPRKRRKSHIKEEINAIEEIEALPQKQRKGKAGAKRRRTSPAQEAPLKRSRAHSMTKNKPNLSEEQKRQNHIASEQKRRLMIGQGFEEMDELVPELKGANHSKSVKLEIAARFLTDLIEGNSFLRDKLAEAGVNGYNSSS